MIKGNCHHHTRRSGSSAERRTGKRLLCSELIRLRWTEPSGARREEIAIVEDLSTCGASLFTGVPVDTGTAVTLCTRERSFTAEVRHCIAAPNGHMVGVHVEDGWTVCRGEAIGYTPEHLLDVARLDFTPGE